MTQLNETAPFWNTLRRSCGGAGEAPCLVHLRERAADFLGSAVLPGTRDESWRYTDLKDLARQSFSLVEAVPTSLVGAPEG
ncbi:MAG: hypothetical protein HGA80_06165, partial [Candidatus Omnitrophica bacterium]|nr:hypothetical protein [Candidatus Omnitrophota bacterium]